MERAFTRKSWKALVARLRKVDGAALVEYAIIVALIALVCIASLTTLGRNMSTALSSAASSI